MQSVLAALILYTVRSPLAMSNLHFRYLTLAAMAVVYNLSIALKMAFYVAA